MLPRLELWGVLHRKSWATPSGRAIRCNSRSLALPGIYASIPVAFARWRSLRAPLAKENGVAPMNAHPVVLSHCATRARASNPAGPPLRFGLLQGDGHLRLKIQCANGLSRAGRESRRPRSWLTRTLQRLVCGAPAPEARGRRVGAALRAPGDSTVTRLARSASHATAGRLDAHS